MIQRSLNEGRSVNPGDTVYTARHANVYCQFIRDRSTKAGASTPATPSPQENATHHARRTSAQRRPERQPRRHYLVTHLSRHVPRGRSAQRRPERQPRRHTNGAQGPPQVDARSAALNEGRSVNPGDTPRILQKVAWSSDKPSRTLNEGAERQPRRRPLNSAAISRDFGRYPVRIVRIKQSRLP